MSGLTCMSQTEGPESQIRGRVGDAAQAVLDGVDGLMHEHVCSVELLQAAQFQTLNKKHERSSNTYSSAVVYTSSSAAPPSTSP